MSGFFGRGNESGVNVYDGHVARVAHGVGHADGEQERAACTSGRQCFRLFHTEGLIAAH